MSNIIHCEKLKVEKGQNDILEETENKPVAQSSLDLAVSNIEEYNVKYGCNCKKGKLKVKMVKMIKYQVYSLELCN